MWEAMGGGSPYVGQLGGVPNVGLWGGGVVPNVGPYGAICGAALLCLSLHEAPPPREALPAVASYANEQERPPMTALRYANRAALSIQSALSGRPCVRRDVLRVPAARSPIG